MSQLRKFFQSNKTRTKQSEIMFHNTTETYDQLYVYYCDKIYEESIQMHSELYRSEPVDFNFFQTDLFIEQSKMK